MTKIFILAFCISIFPRAFGADRREEARKAIIQILHLPANVSELRLEQEYESKFESFHPDIQTVLVSNWRIYTEPTQAEAESRYNEKVREAFRKYGALTAFSLYRSDLLRLEEEVGGPDYWKQNDRRLRLLAEEFNRSIDGTLTARRPSQASILRFFSLFTNVFTYSNFNEYTRREATLEPVRFNVSSLLKYAIANASNTLTAVSYVAASANHSLFFSDQPASASFDEIRRHAGRKDLSINEFVYELFLTDTEDFEKSDRHVSEMYAIATKSLSSREALDLAEKIYHAAGKLERPLIVAGLEHWVLNKFIEDKALARQIMKERFNFGLGFFAGKCSGLIYGMAKRALL